MLRLLIIEDSPLIQKVIKHLAATELNCEYDLAGSMQETVSLIDQHDYFLALADLNLPDAPNGEVVDMLLSADISTIVLTASMNDSKRQKMLDKGVLDYIYKENRDSYFTAVKLANQILLNKHTTILLADDSRTLRNYICTQLKKMLYTVIEVENGQQALEALEQHPKIELLITDYNMPVMNGIELIKQIRQSRNRNTFPIIGLSSSNDPTLSAQFIKYGANDFLITPFIHEEFQWRILRTMEQIALFRKISDAANQDYLTKIYNRRYFFDTTKKALKALEKQRQPLNIALIDIDYFKKVNDTFGHDSGDAVLVQVAQMLKKIFTGFTVARYGGEEFIVAVENVALELAVKYFDKFRQEVENRHFTVPDGILRSSVSIGVAQSRGESLLALINRADVALYRAKENGRNRIEMAQ
ncbi:MAG: GGDEF domain-containing response regulator [Pseudomonadales bacterium]